MKEKKEALLLIPIAIVLALLAGGNLFIAVILLLKYQDYSNMLKYLSHGIVCALFYATVMHLWFLVQFQKHTVFTVPKTPMASLAKQQYRIRGIRGGFALLFVVGDLIACVCFCLLYDFFWSLLFSVCMSLVTLLVIILIFLRRWKVDAFTDYFCAMDSAGIEQDNDSLYFYQKIVNDRLMPMYFFALFIQMYLVLCFLNWHFDSFNRRFFMCSFLYIVLLLIVNGLLFRKAADYIIIVGLGSNAQGILAMLKQFYTERSYWLKPRRNIHTFVVFALYHLERYEDAFKLATLIDARHRKAFAYYTAMLILICQQQLHDEEGMRMTMGQMQEIWALSTTHRSNKKQWECGRYIYELCAAWLRHDTKALEAKIGKSKKMSSVIQEVAERMITLPFIVTNH